MSNRARRLSGRGALSSMLQLLAVLACQEATRLNIGTRLWRLGEARRGERILGYCISLEAQGFAKGPQKR